MVTAVVKAPAPSLSAAGLVMTDIRLIRRRSCTIRPRPSLFVVWCIRRDALRSNRVNRICCHLVLCHDNLFIGGRGQFDKTFFHLALLKGDLSNFMLNEIGQGNGKGESADHLSRDHVNGLGLGTTVVYSLFHRRLKCSTLKIFILRSAHHYFDHEYHLGMKGRFRGSASISKEAYDSFQYQRRHSGGLLADSTLQTGQRSEMRGLGLRGVASSGPGRYSMASNVPSPIGGGGTTSFKAASNECATVEELQTAYAALNAVAIWRPSYSMSSGLWTAVNLSLHEH